MIANIIKTTAKNLMFLYYRKKSTCSLCKESNNTLFRRTICSDKTCNGYMQIDYDEMSIYQELKFLNELVDVNNNQIKDNNIDNDKGNHLINFDSAVKSIKKYLRALNNKIMFTKVNISELFSFLD